MAGPAGGRAGFCLHAVFGEAERPLEDGVQAVHRRRKGDKRAAVDPGAPFTSEPCEWQAV